MDVAAVKATVEPKDGIANRNDRVAPSQIVRIGDLKRLSTLANQWGRPPSRAKPNIMRELEVNEKSPQCQTQMMINANRTKAPVSPKMSMKICRTGCSTSLSTVVSKCWMEKRSEMIKKNPKMPDTPTDIRTPKGADQLAFCVSSLKCALASKPVIVYFSARRSASVRLRIPILNQKHVRIGSSRCHKLRHMPATLASPIRLHQSPCHHRRLRKRIWRTGG